MSFGRYPKKKETTSEISIRFSDQEHLGMPLANQIPGSESNISRMSWAMKLIFYIYRYQEPTNWFKHIYWVYSDIPRYTQSTFEWWICIISRLNGGIKLSFCMWVIEFYASVELIQDITKTFWILCITMGCCLQGVLLFYYCDQVWCKTFRITYRVLSNSQLIFGPGVTDILQENCY